MLANEATSIFIVILICIYKLLWNCAVLILIGQLLKSSVTVYASLTLALQISGSHGKNIDKEILNESSVLYHHKLLSLEYNYKE